MASRPKKKAAPKKKASPKKKVASKKTPPRKKASSKKKAPAKKTPSKKPGDRTQQRLDAAREEIAKLSSLIDASQTINSSLELDEILPLILKTATKNVKADRGTIYLVDRNTSEIWSKVLQGDEMMEIRLPLGQGLSGYVAQTGDPILIEDAYKDPRFNQETDRASGYRTRSVLCTPMRNKNREIIGVFQLLNKRGGPFSQNDVDFLDALSAHAAIAIENAYLLQESIRKEALEREMEVARSIQQRLLPGRPPEIPGYDLLGMNTPCEAVGGDYYDFIPYSGGRWIVAIGDVVGHGVPAALLMANLYATLRSHAQYDLGLTEMVAKVNDFIHRSTDTMQYATFFIGVLDPSDGTYTFVNAGHNPPYHLRCNREGDDRLATMNEGGIPLGMMPHMKYESGQVTLEKGDIIYLFTDGVSEAYDENEDLLGEEPLERVLRECAGMGLNNVIHEIQMEVRAHTGDTPQPDDVTMVAFQRVD